MGQGCLKGAEVNHKNKKIDKCGKCNNTIL